MNFALKSSSIKAALAVALIVAILLPLYNIFFIYPSFKGQLVQNIEDEAVRVVTHISLMFIPEETSELRKDSLPHDLVRISEAVKRDFRLWKLQIFSETGEVVYSTDPKDIGNINKHGYFHESVAKGKVLSKVVKKDTLTLGGQKATADVVETYIPIMKKDGRFIGAFEIYYDITAKKEGLNALINRYSFILLFVCISSIGFIIFLFIAHCKLVAANDRVLSEVAERKKAEERLRQSVYLLNSIRHIQHGFIASADSGTSFENLLKELISITNSAFGFIGEVLYKAEDEPYLKTHSITNIAWTEELKRFYERQASKGLEFYNMNTLFGAVIKTGLPVISNNPSQDPRRGGLPEGHPRLEAFLGLPIYSGNRLVGMAGIANRHGGYNEEMVEFLQPFLITCGNLIEAYRKEQIRKAMEDELRKKTEQLEDLAKRLESRVREETDRRMEKERLLLHQSKFAAMGEMIGAIAHQWRQPLNAVGLIVQGIGDAYKYGELDKDYVDESVRQSMLQINMMSKTIDDFINFFKPSKHKETFDTMAAVCEVLSLTATQFKARSINYRLTCHTHGNTFYDFRDIILCGAKTITGYKNEFKHAILNLLNNAKDAITERIEKGLMPQGEEGTIGFDFYRQDERLIITISDNGGGMPEEIINRIFEPYFTTKEQGKGTGIGLYMTKMIVEKSMGGIITARNISGGAEMRIELPLIPPPPRKSTVKPMG